MILDSNSASSKSPDPQVQDSGSSSIELTWENDPRNPFNWPLSRKWATMFVSYWVAIMVGINATSFTTAAEGLSHEFNVSNSFFEYSFFAVTSWTATAAIVPLATLPMMETFGFRIGYVVCARRLYYNQKIEEALANDKIQFQGAYILFVIFIIPQCVAPNFATLVVCRVFAGAFGGTVQNAADGIAANIFFTVQERILPLTLYAFTLMFGVTIGPVFGALYEPLGWRW